MFETDILQKYFKQETYLYWEQWRSLRSHYSNRAELKISEKLIYILFWDEIYIISQTICNIMFHLLIFTLLFGAS